MLSLLELKTHLKHNHLVGIETLARQFDMPVSLLEDMLARLQQKGLVIRREPSASCTSGCKQACPAAEHSVYEWVGAKIGPEPA